MVKFLENINQLWLQANTDQRIFLVILTFLSVLFFLMVVLVIRWRIVNRHEIKKAKHLSAMRSLILEKKVT